VKSMVRDLLNVSKKKNFTKAFCAPQKKGKIGLEIGVI